jgi:hypothetical protein
MVYAADDFTKADGLTVGRIARWDGASRSALPEGALPVGDHLGDCGISVVSRIPPERRKSAKP